MIYWKLPQADVAKLADASDLKSDGTHLPYRFEPGHRHHRERRPRLARGAVLYRTAAGSTGLVCAVEKAESSCLGQWYRIEKAYGATMCTDSMVQGYHPISAYNSTQNANIQNYVNMYWDDILYNDINHYLYVLGCADTTQSRLCGIKYVLSKNSEAVIPDTEAVRQFGDVYVYRFKDVGNICSYYPYSDVSGTFGTASDGFTSTVTVDYDRRDTKAQIYMKDNGKNGRIDGNVTVIQQGVLFIAIPFENGWSVYVDGEKTEMRKANEGFIGVDLEAGTHDISLRYVCPGLIKGIIVSLFSVMLLILFSVLIRKRDAKTEGRDNWYNVTPAELAIGAVLIPVIRRIRPETADAYQAGLEPPEPKPTRRRPRRRGEKKAVPGEKQSLLGKKRPVPGSKRKQGTETGPDLNNRTATAPDPVNSPAAGPKKKRKRKKRADHNTL